MRAGHVKVDGLDIVAADARGETERPHGYGVCVLHGAFTLWNMQAADDVAISADIVGISAGRDGAPVRGGGIFVGGAGDTGDRVLVRRLETGGIYSDGGIAPGTPDSISGGVFVVYGAAADLVRNRGPLTTYGANDMVLDNWGTVDRWIAEEKITSHGPSGIGFVNFGTVNSLQVNAPIQTFGQGARGFNVYTGTVNEVGIPRDADVYLCGPTRFMADMKEALAASGVAPERIHVEIFNRSEAMTPGVVGAATRAPHLPKNDANSGPLVSFARSGIAAHWKASAYQSILELAEACDVPVRWACRTGVCHNCESGLVSGAVAYGPQPLENPADGNLLICCSQPLGDVVIDL